MQFAVCLGECRVSQSSDWSEILDLAATLDPIGRGGGQPAAPRGGAQICRRIFRRLCQVLGALARDVGGLGIDIVVADGRADLLVLGIAGGHGLAYESDVQSVLLGHGEDLAGGLLKDGLDEAGGLGQLVGQVGSVEGLEGLVGQVQFGSSVLQRRTGLFGRRHGAFHQAVAIALGAFGPQVLADHFLHLAERLDALRLAVVEPDQVVAELGFHR